MPDLLLTAAVLITLALAFYSVGVWAEKISVYLKAWHVVSFWVGFAFDTSGTVAMDLLEPGIDWASAHTITGQIALWLMFVHATWATIVLRRGNQSARMRFHRFSLIVWAIWLVPYWGGMYLGMTG